MGIWPPGLPYIVLPNYKFGNSVWRNTMIIICPKYIFLWLFYITKGSKLGSYCILLILVSFGYLTHRGDPVLLPPAIWQFILPNIILGSKYIFMDNLYQQRIPIGILFAYYQYLAVIVGQNLGTWPPGVIIYMVTPNFFAINVEEISSCFLLNVFLWLHKMVQIGKLFE